jgi:hypothetical protein
VLFFNPNFPFQDLNKLNPFNFRKNIISAITPLLKIPLEQIAEQDMYRGMPIEKYPGYKAPVCQGTPPGHARETRHRDG